MKTSDEKRVKANDYRTVVIGGDVRPTGRYESLFARGEADQIFGHLVPEFRLADYSIVNLECPLVSIASPITKTGKNFRASAECLSGIVNAGIRAVNLANNHIMDQGETGLRSTLVACRLRSIDCVGAGSNLEQASRLLVSSLGTIRVAFLGLAEREFSSAGRRSPGFNPFDLMTVYKIMRLAREEYDYLIVLYHGGTEYYPYPSPRLQSACRLLIELGANAVICQHSHCPGCYEWYRGYPIVYGQGNLITDGPAGGNPERYKGFLVKLKLAPPPGRSVTMERVNYVQSVGQLGVRRMNSAQETTFERELHERSRTAADPEAIENEWRRHCDNKCPEYLSRLFGYGRVLSAINRRTRFKQKTLRAGRLAVLLNLVRCESHNEALVSILETLLAEKASEAKDRRADGL